ncbi:MAG: diaminopimelate epimerase [Chloroflexi bacterium]|nr:diaminopimelate epimerase [Chloroflexota bacterium]
MRFAKLHGVGNDYILMDAREIERNWSALARTMCDRHFGIGADGIILAALSRQADLRMRMFNPDGSEAEMCGNGIRCLTKFVLERSLVSWNSKTLRVETLAGIRVVEPVLQGGKVTAARVAMGIPRLRPEEVPVDTSRLLAAVAPNKRGEGPLLDWPFSVAGQDLKITTVSMGNPHAVAFLDRPVDEFPLHIVGPQIEHHPLFPNRVNFEIVNLVGSSQLRARVWERGAGETLACGTGACAIGVAARLLGHASEDVDITLSGGTLAVHWDGHGEVFLEGPVEEVFEGEWGG